MKRDPIAIVGPTASGKTGLAVAVAEAVDGEIISVDSRQIYRGLDIGTAKPRPEEMTRAPHHGIDLVSPDHRFSAGQFSDFARAAMADIQGRERLPILAGGTGFFLRALTHPIFEEPPLDPRRRKALAGYLGGMRSEEQLRWLSRLDPESAERFSDWGGRQRVLRALEMPLLTGRTLPWWHAHAPPSEPPIRPQTFVLDLPRELLYRRIEDRVDRMIEAGLLDEVKGLLSAGYTADSPGMRTVGYAELIPVVLGGTTIEAAIETVKKNTRRYARRQLTWFRHRLPPGAIWLNGTQPTEALVERITSRLDDQDT